MSLADTYTAVCRVYQFQSGFIKVSIVFLIGLALPFLGATLYGHDPLLMRNSGNHHFEAMDSPGSPGLSYAVMNHEFSLGHLRGLGLAFWGFQV